MSRKGVGERARALAHQECDAILQGLSARRDRHDAVHAARKAIRRLRALLALLEHSDLDASRVDRVLQRLGDSLSRIRDAHVVSETAMVLKRNHPGLAWRTAVDALSHRREHIMRSEMDGDPEFARRRRLLSQVDAWLTVQAWDSLGAGTFESGIARSTRRAAKAARRAAHDDDPESIHRWRRRIRRLRMQQEALQVLGISVRPRGGGHASTTKALHKLSDQLGWQQDLRMLRNLVRPMAVWPGKDAVLKVLGDSLQAASVDAGRHG